VSSLKYYTLIFLQSKLNYRLLTSNKQTSKQANKQTSKQANKQTSKQANKQTSKQANKQASKQTIRTLSRKLAGKNMPHKS
jgi:hypothetical protein